MLRHDHQPSGPGTEWYQSAVIYELDVKNIRDSNADGIGDFRGLISRLDYIASLGVECVWLQPFYVTPDRDNGYDIADYRRVDPRLGTMDDVEAFIAAAYSERNLRIADLPLNHTSDQHGWFQAARSDRNSPYHDWYIWADKKPKNNSPYPVFGPLQDGNWEWDDQAKQFYFHTFYQFMPDLNMANPAVEKELLAIARFWMEKGLHGFRLDAVPFLIHDTSEAEKLKEPHSFLKDLHRTVRAVRADAILLAEANLKPKEMLPYFGDGDGDEMHLLLNFYLCNHVFLSIATSEARHIERAWDELPKIPKSGQWANFLRNHDELSLDQLTKAEQQRVFEALAPREDMRAYGRGIRRRLAPMLEGDLRRIKLAYSLLLSLPGTPVINAGEEIGLGDDLSLKERESGRTPMQWSDTANAGFSEAPREKLYRPVIDTGPFSYSRINVQAQEHDKGSLLHFMRRAIAAYRAMSAFGMGQWKFLKSGEKDVLAHCCELKGHSVYAVHNLSSEARRVRVDLPEGLQDILNDSDYRPVRDRVVTLQPYGFRWLRPQEEL